VSNEDESIGCTCIGEIHALETIHKGKTEFGLLKFGDLVRIKHFDKQGLSVFGAIDQKIGDSAIGVITASTVAPYSCGLGKGPVEQQRCESCDGNNASRGRVRPTPRRAPQAWGGCHAYDARTTGCRARAPIRPSPAERRTGS